jgi:hypothetical protein
MKSLILLWPVVVVAADSNWVAHIVAADFRTNTAVAADFTGDGLIDVIANGGPAREDVLFIAPGWRRVVIGRGVDAIHSAILDADGDGDLDYVAARYSPALIYALERPRDPLKDAWSMRVIDDHARGGVNGVHALLVADVNRDGKPDLIANSAEAKGAYPNSLAWFEAPRWTRHLFAHGDAPGLSHYLGFGDVNGDGRPDIASAAKIPPDGNWFAWWQAPRNPRERWTKHLIAKDQQGATNIAVADVNRDGRPDFIATRGHARGVLWFEGPRWTVHDIDAGHQYPHSLAVGDLDGDGDIDAVACSAVYSKVPANPVLAWFENDGRGGFTTHRISDVQASYDVRLADMDRDGDLDILVAGQESRNVLWYENRIPRRR